MSESVSDEAERIMNRTRQETARKEMLQVSTHLLAALIQTIGTSWWDATPSTKSRTVKVAVDMAERLICELDPVLEKTP